MKVRMFGLLAGLAAAFLLAAAPARAEWRRAESPHFVLYGTLSEARLRERILLLEDFDRLMRTVTSISAPPAANKLSVYIVDGPADLRLIHPVPAGIVGFYTATPDGIAAVVDGRAEAGGNEVLFHEYAHHFMMQYAANAYPAWYVEGFAEYFQTVRFGPRRIDIGNYSQGSAYALVAREWLPMDRVLYGNPQSLAGDALGLFYAQSWLTVHYFYSTPERQAALGRYLAAIGGDNAESALQTAIGMDPAAFTQELRRYIRGNQIRYRQMDRLATAAPPPAVAVTTLPAAADDLMVYQAALALGIEESKGPDYLQRIRAAAARHAGDPFAQRVLAHAELLYGDSAAADRLLDALLAASPNDAGLMYLKGMRYLIAAERADDGEADSRLARTWFTRAHRADANHFQTLHRFAQALRGESNYVSENTANVLLLAHELAPQVATVTMNAAAMLMARGDYAAAAALVAPLAADPHNASLARAARHLIEQARTRAQAATDAAPAPH
jgi:hypothetical protein